MKAYDRIREMQCIAGCSSMTCNPGTVEANFRNAVGLIPVEGKSPSIGGRIA